MQRFKKKIEQSCFINQLIYFSDFLTFFLSTKHQMKCVPQRTLMMHVALLPSFRIRGGICDLPGMATCCAETPLHNILSRCAPSFVAIKEIVFAAPHWMMATHFHGPSSYHKRRVRLYAGLSRRLLGLYNKTSQLL